MERRILKLLASALTLWTVFTLALCIRSYFVRDTFSFQPHSDARYEVISNNGELGVEQSNPRVVRQSPLNQGWIPWKYAKLQPVTINWRAILAAPDKSHSSRAYGFMHFGYSFWVISGITAERSFDMPLWFGIALSGICAMVAIKSYRRSMRAPGSCVTCGYDLRATPERCPECGAVVNKVVASQIQADV